MAKIEINYDLIEKIQQAKDENILQRYSKAVIVKRAIPITTIVTIGYTIGGLTKIIPPEEVIKGIITYGIIPNAIGLTMLPIILKIPKIREEDQEQAKKELKTLSQQLNSQFIKTSLPLLLESKQYHKEHKFVINKKGLPCIMENKYIMIPTYNDGDIKETSILQEHKIGSKKYVLSLGSPVQAKQFKPAYGF